MQAPRKNTPALAVPATPKIRPCTVGGPAMQAPTSKRQGLRKKIAISKFHRRGEHCSPGFAECWLLRFAPHLHRTPPPASNTRNPENIPPHRWRACNAGPYKRKARPTQKHPQPFLLYSRGEHCSPAKALCCRKAPRVEQSPTPTINRKRMREIFIAILQFHRRGEHCSPALAAPATPKIHPRTVGGPAMQTPTSERQASRKIPSLFPII